MIHFENVTKLYDSKLYALRNVSFKVAAGEFVSIVGSSGAGKSTLVRLLLKEVEQSDGTIIVNNTDLSIIKKKQIPFYRRQIGVVFQDFRLLTDRTAFENVSISLEINEIPKNIIITKVQYALAMVGLSARAKSYPKDMSGGEQQRVSLARALVNNPSILIADEPTGNLDPLTTIEIFRILSNINRRGTTVVVTTHAKDAVNLMQKRVIYLENGRVVNNVVKSGYFYET